MKKFALGVAFGTVLGPAAILAVLGWKAGRSPDRTYSFSIGDASKVKAFVDLSD